MILADTSVWIPHLRVPDIRLLGLLKAEEVLCHPFVIAEVALGGNRRTIVHFMQLLVQATRAEDSEVLRFIHDHRLYGRGIGYVDAHLLASVLIMPGTRLWTRDQKLHAVASELDIAA